MFGQLVIGPPGSGKSTYCHGLYQFLNGVERKTIVVNLDPANDLLAQVKFDTKVVSKFPSFCIVMTVR
jgi:predicted PilT family ATPase